MKRPSTVSYCGTYMTGHAKMGKKWSGQYKHLNLLSIAFKVYISKYLLVCILFYQGNC